MTELETAEKALSQARATLSSLERARADGMARATAIASDRRKIGYLAHTAGGAARKQLDDLNREGAVLAGELESLGAAVEEAGARVTTAEQGVARAVARATAMQARDKYVPEVKRAGASLSAALDAFGENLGAYLDAARLIERSVGGISRAPMESFLRRALNARLFPLGMSFDPLPMPADRVPGVEVLTEKICEFAAGHIGEMLRDEPDSSELVDDGASAEEAA
jgi:hypothetical protein